MPTLHITNGDCAADTLRLIVNDPVAGRRPLVTIDAGPDELDLAPRGPSPWIGPQPVAMGRGAETLVS